MSNVGIAYAIHKACRVVNKVDHLAKPLTASQLEEVLNNDLVLESCTLEDIETTLFNGVPVAENFMLEAISCKKNKVNVTVAAFGRALGKELVGAGITVDYRNAEVSKPRKVGLAAVMTAKVALSDGQSVSIVFHAPDDDPLVIKDSDTLIAFRFLMNSRDITHVVAPQGGSEISLAQVTKNIGNVVTANTEKFQAKQAENVALKAQIEDAEKQGEQLESEIASINDQEVKLKDAIEVSNSNIDKIQKRIDKQNELQESLQAEIDSIKAVKPVEPATTTSQPDNNGGNNAIAGIIAELEAGQITLKDAKADISVEANKVGGDLQAAILNARGITRKTAYIEEIKRIVTSNTAKVSSDESESKTEPEAKYWYGMRIRPIGFGTQPDGHIAQMSAEQAAAKFPDFTERDYRFGAVGYANALSNDVIEHYNLTDFQKTNDVNADIDVAEVAIEDAIDHRLKNLGVKGFTQSQIDELITEFDNAHGSNKQKVQTLFAKELREDYTFVNRKTMVEEFKTFEASLDLIDKAMLTKYLNKVLIADATPEPEKEPKLIAVSAGDRLTIDGETYGVDSVRSDLIKVTILDDDREQFTITDQDDPFLSRAKRAGYVFKGFVTEDSINEVIENGIERAKVLAKNNLKKSDYQANGTLTFDGQDKLVDILASKGFDNKKTITVDNINYVSLARCIVSKYNDALYQQSKATTPEPTTEPQQASNTDGFKATMADCLDNFKNGSVSLADTKKRIKSLLKDSPQADVMLDRVNELLAQRAKAKFISAFNDVLDFEADAPVVDGIDFNNINFNMFDGGDDFGKSWAYVAKRNPQRLIDYVESDDTHGLTAANKENIVAAIKAKYMVQAEPEPQLEPQPEVEPETAVSDATDPEVEKAASILNQINDQEVIENPKADLDRVNAAVEVLKAAGVEYKYEGLIGDITDKLISALMNVVKGLGA
ncbi:hypothetical protein I3271_05705 [Photobacterium leiognathi]|uniref:defense against restriction DarA-related protein n=1 Tax=Photobacterium leiognathi TaxID=553611 RepID=UPI001EDCD844|nr:hypothetical protein [Photobacterium leiognathi]MCG3884177.1 hypothetical protein [Photobacterium leiognathi]